MKDIADRLLELLNPIWSEKLSALESNKQPFFSKRHFSRKVYGTQ